SVMVTDSQQRTSSKSFSLFINPAPTDGGPLGGLLSFTSGSPLPAGIVGAPYSFTFGATGGIQPYGFSGSGLPPGLTLSPSGALTGTPTAAGQFSLSIQVA